MQNSRTSEATSRQESDSAKGLGDPHLTGSQQRCPDPVDPGSVVLLAIIKEYEMRTRELALLLTTLLVVGVAFSGHVRADRDPMADYDCSGEAELRGFAECLSSGFYRHGLWTVQKLRHTSPEGMTGRSALNVSYGDRLL